MPAERKTRGQVTDDRPITVLTVRVALRQGRFADGTLMGRTQSEAAIAKEIIARMKGYRTPPTIFINSGDYDIVDATIVSQLSQVEPVEADTGVTA